MKLTSAKGAQLKDPSGLLDSSLTGGARRAIDLRQGDEIDEAALTALVQAAAALTTSESAGRRRQCQEAQ